MKKSAIKTGEREKIAVWLDHDQLAKLREIQRREDVPVSSMIRRAINDLLRKRKKK
jgi:hypothetical protein